MNSDVFGRRIGFRIRQARLARGLNRSEFAREVGTSWAVVNRWEKGVTLPSLASIIRVAEVLRVSFDQLLAATTPGPTSDVSEREATNSETMLNVVARRSRATP